MLSIALVLMLSLPGVLVESGQPGQEADLLIQKTHHFEHQGIVVEETRTVDSATGLIMRRAVDADGNLVDLDALRWEEQRRKIAARGKISPELGRLIAEHESIDELQVVFWLDAGVEPDFRTIILNAMNEGLHIEDARRRALAAAEEFFTPVNTAFADRLAAEGHSVDYIGDHCPIVVTTLPSGAVGPLALVEAVDQAYYCFPSWAHENNYAQPTLRTTTVHRRGINGGSAVKVMVQDSGGNVATNNPFLPTVIKLNSGGTDYHATAVAGNVCMTGHMTLFGAAPSLNEIYTAEGWGDIDAPAAWALGMAAGVSYGNCSWWNLTKGAIVYLDRYFDYIIRNYSVQMFKSNGNQGWSPPEYSTSPGNGYNVFSTGCYNDGDTWKWDDDAMASYSSFLNPVEGHDKPNVASPGDEVDTTGTSAPWIYYGFSGTSSASPLTMGVATLVANRDPSIIPFPEALKAILSVSAWHNIEGNAELSEYDGLGGIHAGAADAVARDGQYEVGTFTTSSFPGGYYDKQIFCYKGDGTRVICYWHSDPDSSYSTDILKMDLDIAILDPNGSTVASAANIYNPFEIVYFEPAQTGTYTIRLTEQTFLGTSEPYCIAWSSRQDAACAEVTLSGSGQIGTTLNMTFYDQYEAGEDFVTLPSFGTLPSLIDLDGGYILPVAYDTLARAAYTGTFPGFVGTLDGSGTALNSIVIPNNPALIGRTVNFAMLVHDGSLVPRDTSEIESITIN